MSFFEFLQWRSAPMSARKRIAIWGHIALWAACCQSGMAQTPTSAQEAIKKALQSGQLDQAAKLVQQERERSPKDVQMRFMEGVIQAQQGQTDKAIETFRQITQSQPDMSEAYNNLGVLYAAKGRLEESKTYLEKALQTHPSYAAAHRNLSDVHSQLAKQNYAKALQVEPKVKQSPPQLTLLGSIGNDKRLQPTSTASVANPPAVSNVIPPIPAAHTVPTPAVVTTAASAPVANAKPANTPAATVIAAAPAKPAVVASAPPAAVPVAAPAAPQPAQPVKPAGTLATSTSAAAASVASAAPSAPVKPAENAGKDDQAAIKSAVTAWAKAWSQKDMPKYLAAYAETFTPADKMSRAKWESDRRARIVSKKTIAVGIHQLQITLNGNKATVKFQQIYESDNFKGNSRKILEMHKQGHQWLIVRETVN